MGRWMVLWDGAVGGHCGMVLWVSAVNLLQPLSSKMNCKLVQIEEMAATPPLLALNTLQHAVSTGKKSYHQRCFLAIDEGTSRTPAAKCA